MRPMEVSQPKTVQIVAPCSMEGGFTFMATYEGQSFRVTVPPGGVKQGEQFMAPLGSNGNLMTATEVTPFILNSAVGIDEHQLGKWNDKLFDCCRYGLFHPALWNAIVCPQILMAQVLTRLKLNWLGDRAPDTQWKKTFQTILIIVALYWILSTALAPPRPIWVRNEAGVPVRLNAPSVSSLQLTLYRLVGWSFALYTWMVLTKVRRYVRMRYEIPNQYRFLGPYEDFCLAVWCGCCTVAQLARQTAEYEQQPAACCSPNGLGSSSLLSDPSSSSSILTV